ncbi:GspE/PulE family protein [Marinomonas epiphytica]
MTLEEILSLAIAQQATDIHIHLTKQGPKILVRRFGQLQPLSHNDFCGNLSNRIKMRANLDLSENRRCQEGQFIFASNGVSTCVRVSMLSTVQGEKIALRLLPERTKLALAEIGLPQPLLKKLQQSLNNRQGLILVCGATGAGKSTTLYACLDQLNTGEKSIFTIEDPVEYKVPGLFQCEPNDALDQDPVSLLKAFLRQDPDVIMVGEIRDAKTANLAVNASLTGHLVLATLHTNSALDAIQRCSAWQVDFFSLVSSLSLIIHQSMHYGHESRRAVFTGLAPNWRASLPNCYEELMITPTLWQALP